LAFALAGADADAASLRSLAAYKDFPQPKLPRRIIHGYSECLTDLKALSRSLINVLPAYWYVVALSDYNFTGTCVISFKLTQVKSGTTVTLDSGTIKSFSCSPKTNWAWAALGTPIPSSSGIATLTGSVKYGSATSTVKTTVLLQ
jgi:hypothetical protein